MNQIKTEAQIAGIRRSCQLAAQVLAHASQFIKPGISTETLNDISEKFTQEHGAISAPKNYKGFPKSICTSINNVVCHGIPSHKQILKEGDIINLDITTILDGYYGDTSATFPVGQISPLAQKLIDVTRKSLYLSIKALAPGKYINDCVGKIIEPFVQKSGFSVVRDLGGHGVGLAFHEELFVYHFNNSRNDIKLQPGMTFTIEPMINASHNPNIVLDNHDGWTIYTQDGSLSAQFEHTVLITSKGSEILTQI